MTIREHRHKEFIEKYLDELKHFHFVDDHPSDGYKITTEEMGTFIFYPKSNKLLETENNLWRFNGLRFVRKTLLHYAD